jgi:hypothetical protein
MSSKGSQQSHIRYISNGVNFEELFSLKLQSEDVFTGMWKVIINKNHYLVIR